MSASKGLFKKYSNPVFVETGTFHGDGVQQALDEGFNMVYSIELSLELHEQCAKRFINNSKVILIQGDSSNELSKVINNITVPITFWLDGHYCGVGTAVGRVNSPLLQELDEIKEHPIKTHTILIDDLRGWHKATRGFDTSDLIKKIEEINPSYVFTFEDGYDYNLNIFYPNDILVAKCL